MCQLEHGCHVLGHPLGQLPPGQSSRYLPHLTPCLKPTSSSVPPPVFGMWTSCSLRSKPPGTTANASSRAGASAASALGAMGAPEAQQAAAPSSMAQKTQRCLFKSVSREAKGRKKDKDSGFCYLLSIEGQNSWVAHEIRRRGRLAQRRQRRREAGEGLVTLVPYETRLVQVSGALGDSFQSVRHGGRAVPHRHGDFAMGYLQSKPICDHCVTIIVTRSL